MISQLYRAKYIIIKYDNLFISIYFNVYFIQFYINIKLFIRSIYGLISVYNSRASNHLSYIYGCRTECRTDKMSIRQNVEQTKCRQSKYRTDKMSTDKMHYACKILKRQLRNVPLTLTCSD